MRKFNTLSKIALLAAVCFTASCSEDDSKNIDVEDGQSVFHVAVDVDINDVAEVLIAPTTILSEGNLSVLETGTEMEGERSAYLAEANGNMYNMNYGTGMIYELGFDEATSKYTELSRVDASVKLGTHPRFEVVGDDNDKLMAFYVAAETDDATGSITPTLKLVDFDLPGLHLRESIELDLGTFAVGEYYISRVDAPVILDGKVYIGTQQKMVGDSDATPEDLKTIVLDYPSLDNLQIVSSTTSSGHNYGFRGRSMYVYNDAVYQLNWATGGSDVVITRLKDGKYDTDYVFNISEKLGGGTYGSVNWFHIGNGKGYAAIEDLSMDVADNWFITYLDVEAKTVQRVEGIPMSDMFEYQNAVVTDGSTFNIAISPTHGDGSYIWQINGAIATKGMQLDGGNVYTQGIY